jgi:uncharacterized protein YaaN involved in tellurite resistance
MAEVTRIKKNKDGYGYKYTELSQLNEYCENNNIDYYQEIETCDINGEDYMITYVSEDGKEYKKHRGCKIVEAILSGIKNPVQEYGSSLTYCRRYSLLMALGLATEDDDGASLNGASKKTKTTKTTKEDKTELASKPQIEFLEKIFKNHEDKKKELLDKYKWNSFADMPKKTASDLIKKYTAKEEKNEG